MADGYLTLLLIDLSLKQGLKYTSWFLNTDNI